MDAGVMESMTTPRSWLFVLADEFSTARLMPRRAPGDFSTSTSNGLWAYWLLSTRATSYSTTADNLSTSFKISVFFQHFVMDALVKENIRVFFTCPFLGSISAPGSDCIRTNLFR